MGKNGSELWAFELRIAFGQKVLSCKYWMHYFAVIVCKSYVERQCQWDAVCSNPLHIKYGQDFGHSFHLITCGLMHTSLGHLFWDADVSEEPANKSTVQKNELILL